MSGGATSRLIGKGVVRTDLKLSFDVSKLGPEKFCLLALISIPTATHLRMVMPITLDELLLQLPCIPTDVGLDTNDVASKSGNMDQPSILQLHTRDACEIVDNDAGRTSVRMRRSVEATFFGNVRQDKSHEHWFTDVRYSLVQRTVQIADSQMLSTSLKSAGRASNRWQQRHSACLGYPVGLKRRDRMLSRDMNRDSG